MSSSISSLCCRAEWFRSSQQSQLVYPTPRPTLTLPNDVVLWINSSAFISVSGSASEILSASSCFCANVGTSTNMSSPSESPYSRASLGRRPFCFLGFPGPAPAPAPPFFAGRPSLPGGFPCSEGPLLAGFDAGQADWFIGRAFCLPLSDLSLEISSIRAAISACCRSSCSSSKRG